MIYVSAESPFDINIPELLNGSDIINFEISGNCSELRFLKFSSLFDAEVRLPERFNLNLATGVDPLEIRSCKSINYIQLIL